MCIEKINPKYIIRAHLNTMRDEETGKLYKSDIFLLFVVPILTSIFLTLILNFFINQKIAETLLTILTISIPLLLSLFVFLYDMGVNTLSKKVELDKKEKLEAIDDTSNNISFIIFLSLIVVVIIGLYLLIINSLDIFNPKLISGYHSLIYIFSGIIFWFLGFFLMSFLMILNRVQILATSSYPHNRE